MPDPQINDLFSLSAIFSLKYRKGSRLCRFTVSSLTKYLLHKLFVQLSIVDDKVYPFMTRVYPSCCLLPAGLCAMSQSSQTSFLIVTVRDSRHECKSHKYAPCDDTSTWAKISDVSGTVLNLCYGRLKQILPSQNVA